MSSELAWHKGQAYDHRLILCLSASYLSLYQTPSPPSAHRSLGKGPVKTFQSVIEVQKSKLFTSILQLGYSSISPSFALKVNKANHPRDHLFL